MKMIICCSPGKEGHEFWYRSLCSAEDKSISDSDIKEDTNINNVTLMRDNGNVSRQKHSICVWR